jgi:arsenate reductase
MSRHRVLFLCTHNSARSQMAEAILRALGGERYEAASAGTEVTRVHPLAAAEMARRGIDTRGQRSKHLDELRGERFDIVITVCDQAAESCPVFPGSPELLHWSLPDPSAAQGSEAEQAAAFERTADALTGRIQDLLSGYTGPAGT